jgi:hypothetical protein
VSPRRDPRPETAERISVDLGESGHAHVRDSGQAHVRPLNEGHRPLHAAAAAVERARCNHGAGSERQHRDRCRNARPRTRAATLPHDRHSHLPGMAWEWLPTIRWAVRATRAVSRRRDRCPTERTPDKQVQTAGLPAATARMPPHAPERAGFSDLRSHAGAISTRYLRGHEGRCRPGLGSPRCSSPIRVRNAAGSPTVAVHNLVERPALQSRARPQRPVCWIAEIDHERNELILGDIKNRPR